MQDHRHWRGLTTALFAISLGIALFGCSRQTPDSVTPPDTVQDEPRDSTGEEVPPEHTQELYDHPPPT